MGISKNDAKWLRQFEVLKEYVRETHKFPSSTKEYKDTKIGPWLRNQQIAYERDILPAERIIMLDAFNPLWRASKEERDKAYQQYVFVSCEWKTKVAEDDVPIDMAFSDDSILGKATSRKALFRCVDHGIYSCRTYLDNRDEWKSWNEVRVVFEAQFPNLTYAYFNLWRAVSSSYNSIFEDASFLNSRFTSRTKMNRVYREVLDSMDPIERSILICCFIKHMSLEDIAIEFDITRDRALSIRAKALRKLRRPLKYQKMTNKVSQSASDNTNDELMNRPIEDLDLSMRSYLCLKRASINTIGDICKLTENELSRVRNVGRKTMEELLCKSHQFGFSLSDNSFDDDFFDDEEWEELSPFIDEEFTLD